MTPEETFQLFKRRPRRSSQCLNCRGLGHVDRGYYLQPSLLTIREGAFTAVVVGSASIFEATQEGSELAKDAKIPVAFCFIDRIVVVGPDDDPVQVARNWWIDFYKETPEESAARR